ncbi:TPA: hypothetical protein HA351_16080 [Methanosarcinaceae archaeon]|nr:hypothetical protein [Methanosarcinaceae archaeon]
MRCRKKIDALEKFREKLEEASFKRIFVLTGTRCTLFSWPVGKKIIIKLYFNSKLF